MSTESSPPPARQIAAGYTAEGQALELGTVVVDGVADPGALDPYPAGDGEPARSGCRSHRHGQDEVAAGDG